MNYLKSFTTLLSTFIQELADMFPEESNLQIYKNWSGTLIKSNPRLVHRYFMSYVYPHKNAILSKDEKFFLDKDYTDELQEMGQGDMMQAMRMKELWTVMTPNSKEHTWNYMQTLITLAEKAAI